MAAYEAPKSAVQLPMRAGQLIWATRTWLHGESGARSHGRRAVKKGTDVLEHYLPSQLRVGYMASTDTATPPMVLRPEGDPVRLTS